jgi:CelD/BcsL family acetyltransferase involved in cellulose biosynthesis
MIDTICPSQLSLSTTVVTDADWNSMAEEWDRLLDASDQRVYFLRWSWIKLWWETYRPQGSRLYIIACRDDFGEVVGLAPFYIRQRRTAGIPHVREIAFLGTGVFVQTSEYLDLIARRGYEELVCRAVVNCLMAREDWDSLWLNEVPSNSKMLPHLQRELGEKAHVAPSNRSRYIDTTVDWDSFLSSLAKSTRYGVVGKTRKLFELHKCRFQRVETLEELTPALDAMIQLHQARLKSKGEPGSFVLDGFESLIRKAAVTGLSEGRIRVWTLEIDGKIAAARLAFFDNGVVHAFQGGFDPAFAKHSLGTIMVGLCVRDCIEDESIREYDFMGGTDRYKDWWTDLGSDTVRLMLTRETLRSTISNCLQTADGLARSFVRKVVPLSLRRAVHDKLIQLRHHAR